MASSLARKPSRTSGWSSTSCILIVAVISCLLSTEVLTIIGSKRCQHRAAAARFDAETPADGIHTLHHIAQSDSALRMQGDTLGIEAFTIVTDAQRYTTGITTQGDGDLPCCRMAADIGQSFLRQPEQYGIRHIRQAVRSATSFKLHRRATAMGVFLPQMLERCCQPQIVQYGRTQIMGNPPYLAHHIAQLICRMLEHALCRFDLAGLAGRQPYHARLDLQLDG